MLKITENEEILRVECVAFLLTNGEIITVPRPGRHCHIIWQMVEEGYSRQDIGEAEQGFLLSNGKFATREEAIVVARNTGQLLNPNTRKSGLFSEDVW